MSKTLESSVEDQLPPKPPKGRNPMGKFWEFINHPEHWVDGMSRQDQATIERAASGEESARTE